MGIRSLVTKLWFAIPIEIVDGEEFKIMYEVWVRDCEWLLYIRARHRRISRHSLGGAETNVALMTGICLSVFALISIMKILFSHENLPFFALISSQPEC